MRMNQHGKSMPKCVKQSVALSIAVWWIKNCERIIAEGGRPRKLSVDVRQYIVDEIGCNYPNYSVPSQTITKLAKETLEIAKMHLMSGRHETVRKFFTP